MMLTDLELMNIHVLALFTHDRESRLLFVNQPDGAAAPTPRFFLGRTRAGNVWRFRADLPENLREQLNELCTEEPPLDNEFCEQPRHLAEMVNLLSNHEPVRQTSSGPAYHFTDSQIPSKPLLAVMQDNAEVLQGGFEKLIDELPKWQPFVAVIEENRAVSVCRSVRITPDAHEAGVETLPDFRGKGHATDVVAEWAQLVRRAGAMPLYSTSWENNASKAVARKLSLRCYGADFHIT